jgi:hypothetical protein
MSSVSCDRDEVRYRAQLPGISSLFYLTLTLRGPRLLGSGCNGLTGMLCYLRCPQVQSEGPRYCSCTVSASNISGAVETSQRISGAACYLAISWCVRHSIVGPVLRAHTMLSPSTQCNGPRTACQSLTLSLQEGIYRSLLLPANGRR